MAIIIMNFFDDKRNKTNSELQGVVINMFFYVKRIKSIFAFKGVFLKPIISVNISIEEGTLLDKKGTIGRDQPCVNNKLKFPLQKSNYILMKATTQHKD